jgi:scyllo-inositol 2-dehydrogenase (NADP+)
VFDHQATATQPATSTRQAPRHPVYLQPVMSEEPPRVALIGYGLAGRVFHGPLLRAAGFAVTTIVTRDRGRRASALRDFPHARILDTADELWGDADQVDCVVVASTPDAHVAQATAAIDAGIPVVVEKPMAVNASAARGLVEHAVARGVMLVPFHNRRWDSDQLTLRRLIAEGALGAVYRYESRFERWRPEPQPDRWRDALPPSEGGGVLLDLGVHLIDQSLSLFGPATHVYGEVRTRRRGADDDVFVGLHHASGVESHLWASAVSAAPGPRLRVLGSRAAFCVSLLDGQEEDLRAGMLPDQPGFGVEPAERWGRLLHGDAGQPVTSEPGRWHTFYEGVRRSLQTGGAPPVSADDAVRVLEVLDAVRRVGVEA